MTSTTDSKVEKEFRALMAISAELLANVGDDPDQNAVEVENAINAVISDLERVRDALHDPESFADGPKPAPRQSVAIGASLSRDDLRQILGDEADAVSDEFMEDMATHMRRTYEEGAKNVDMEAVVTAWISKMTYQPEFQCEHCCSACETYAPFIVETHLPKVYSDDNITHSRYRCCEACLEDVRDLATESNGAARIIHTLTKTEVFIGDMTSYAIGPDGVCCYCGREFADERNTWCPVDDCPSRGDGHENN
ncbi:MAG: hypothetical protein HY741_15855 [Chloroflexi bacterium]|nr:hypothetical protein [Chloroflexota bacterium]